MRYEVGVSIACGDICWVYGGFPAGDWPDVNIFRHALKGKQLDGERVEADDGYIGEHPGHVRCPNGLFNWSEREALQSRVRARHETVNERFKAWSIMREVFCHDMSLHEEAFLP